MWVKTLTFYSDSLLAEHRVLRSNFLFYYFFDRKKYEGSNYQDGTTGDDKKDNAVPPGGQFIYVWQVPKRAGPTQSEDDCSPWAYYSDAYAVKDFYTGLVGPLLVCKKVYDYKISGQ